MTADLKEVMAYMFFDYLILWLCETILSLMRPVDTEFRMGAGVLMRSITGPGEG